MPHVETAPEVLEPGEVRLGGRQQEVVGGRPEDDAVLDDEAAVVAPERVLGATRGAGADVAGEHAGEVALRVATVDAVLEQRRRVEQPGGVADREVLGLLRHLVLRRGQVVRPVLPEARLVQGAGPLVERRRPDHAVASCRGRRRVAAMYASRNVRHVGGADRRRTVRAAALAYPSPVALYDLTDPGDLVAPVLIAAMDGWVDAGSAATARRGRARRRRRRRRHLRRRRAVRLSGSASRPSRSSTASCPS